MTTPIANYLMPGNVRFGFGAAKLAGQEAARLGATHAFIITDPGVVAAGLTEAVVAALSGRRHRPHALRPLPAQPRHRLG
jgi:alcohol dehydrogenase class IV